MSYGQQLTKKFLITLIGLEPMEDYRPAWLEGLELDLFWPQIGFAVEFQGDQHYLPVFGQPDFFRQKSNDQKKKRLLAQRGIKLMQIEAIDLQIGKLNAKLKNAGRMMGIPLRIRNPDAKALSSLSKEATAYRHFLIEKYGSPTSRKKGASRKRERIKWKTEHGLFVGQNEIFKLKRMEQKG